MDIDTNLNEPVQEVFGESQPTSVETSSPSVESSPLEQAPWWQGESYKDKTLGYKAAGKEINEDIDTVLKRASMGYHYAQNMQNLKSERDSFAAEKQKIEDMRGKWEQYDSYARQNPEWRDHVNNAWENRFSQQSQSGIQESSNLPPEIAQKIQSMDTFMQNYERQQQDAALASEISGVRDQYKDVDFDYSDPAIGKSLEMQVLEHAHNTGIGSFRAAFRDFYHDTLVRNSVEQAKKELGSQIQANTKQGILSHSENSQIGHSPNSYQIHSMDDAFNAAANELGINF